MRSNGNIKNSLPSTKPNEDDDLKEEKAEKQLGRTRSGAQAAVVLHLPAASSSLALSPNGPQ